MPTRCAVCEATSMNRLTVERALIRTRRRHDLERSTARLRASRQPGKITCKHSRVQIVSAVSGTRDVAAVAVDVPLATYADSKRHTRVGERTVARRYRSELAARREHRLVKRSIGLESCSDSQE